MSDEIKVIQFKAERSFTYKPLTKPEQRLCSHINIEVDAETRTVHCADCDIVMEPFDYLKDVCFKDDNAFVHHVSLLSEVSKLKRTYNNLIKEIARLKKLKASL
jgi:hypothetical protein